MYRRSYDTALKHLIRLELLHSIPTELLHSIPKSNLHRWRREDGDKYEGCGLNTLATEQLELLRQFNAHCKLPQKQDSLKIE